MIIMSARWVMVRIVRRMGRVRYMRRILPLRFEGTRPSSHLVNIHRGVLELKNTGDECANLYAEERRVMVVVESRLID